jgi:protein FAM32A
LEDRLKREGGGRTHKQRVEELNKYLSGLSEHHDMYVFFLSFMLGELGGRRVGCGLNGLANMCVYRPRIGPG